MLRRRMALVQKRTSVMLSLKSLHTRTLGQSLPQEQVKGLTPETAATLFEDSFDQLVAKVQVQLLQQLAQGIEELEKQKAAFEVKRLAGRINKSEIIGWL